VANQRARLGLSQAQLAARMRISRSKLARIEQGQAPDAETRRQLSHALNPDRGIGPVRRLAAQLGAWRSGVPHGSRWRWSGVAAVVVVLLSTLVILDGGSSNAGPGSLSLQPTIAESDALGVPSALHRARVQAKKAAAARITARRAAARGEAPVNTADRGILAASHPSTEPVSPSSGGGTGGGGGGGSSPHVTDHGSNGGNAPQGAAPSPEPEPAPAESGDGGSTPAPPPRCVLPGILCF
jgi:DNA-binding XRE family transcriptional regulator